MLFIHTNKSNGPGVILFDKTFQSALSETQGEPITLYNEYADFWHFVGDEYVRTLKDFYQKKYAGRHFDLIVVESSPALEFVLAYGDELFPGTPVFFCVLLEPLIKDLSLKPNFTGILMGVNFRKSLEGALRLQPDTTRVFVVAGTSPIDQPDLASARKEFQQFEGQVELTYLTDLSLEEIERRVSVLPEHSIVFYVGLYRDSAGRSFPPVESAARIGKAANVPFYSTAEIVTSAANGVGGYLWSVEAEAVEAAQTARRILAGTKPQDIPVHLADTNRYIFDSRQLKRWGINDQRVPPGSILRFKDQSFWELYKWHIIGVIFLIVLEALLIVRLLISRNRRRKAEEETVRFALDAKAEHERLQEVVSNVPGIVWESRMQNGSDNRTAVFVSPYVERMLGYSVEEWLSKPDFALSTIHENDRVEFSRETAAILESGREGVVRFRWLAKDGRLLWVEAHVAPMRDETGKTVGLRGVTLDITERKRDELALQQLSGRLLMLQDEERSRVASELHDGLGQSLAIIKNRALIGLQDQTNHDRAIDQLEEIAETATAAILEVREIAYNLRPYQLDRLGLVAAIKFMITRVSESTTLNLASDLERIDGLLSPEAETSVYRIVQEGLNNVVKHSSATAARVEIKRGGGKLAISVQDNGKGISRDAPSGNGTKRNARGGVGLAGIAERVRLLDGSFAIDSEPSRGTTLTVHLELPSGTEQ